MSADFCFVSCDIAGHGIDADQAVQEQRIRGINDIVRVSLESCGDLIWASGGDGGHVAFPLPGCSGVAVDLMERLQSWAVETDVALRITGHVGPVALTPGADGRVQLVGSGINLCGSLLDFGAPKSIVVTAAFRECMLTSESAYKLRFKDDRTVYLKHFAPHRLFLMDIEGRVASKWGEPTKSEHTVLEEAVTHRLPWNAIYHAKRLLQVNSGDSRARDVLQEVAKRNVGELVAKPRETGEAPEHNRFLEGMDPNTFFEFAKGAELVERENGEFFCHYDEDGDSMFIILTGEVGIVFESTKSEPAETASKPDNVRFGFGHMVGELAFALRRRRTASLQAIGRTAVLAFNYHKLEEIFKRSKAPDVMRRDNQRFLEGRTLEHLCNQAPYLVGPGKTGPLARISNPWRFMDGGYADTLHLKAGGTSVICATDRRFQRDGLYILASGELVRTPENSRERPSIDGRRLPILYVDFPGSLVHTHHTYRVLSDHAVIVRISQRAFLNIGRAEFENAVAGFRLELVARFAFDVFLAYNSSDHEVATRWHEALENAGLRVYMNVPSGGEHFKPEIVAAILDSAVLMPLVSKTISAGPRGKVRAGEESWVHREVQLRLTMFDREHANIIPIELPGGRAAAVVEGITPIKVDETGSAGGIERAIRRIREIKAGSAAIPFATRRTTLPEGFR